VLGGVPGIYWTPITVARPLSSITGRFARALLFRRIRKVGLSQNKLFCRVKTRVLATSVLVVGQDIHDLQLEFAHQLAKVGVLGVHLCCDQRRIPRPHRNCESCACRKALNPFLEFVKVFAMRNAHEADISVASVRYHKRL
jgi:hypothetical protein